MSFTLATLKTAVQDYLETNEDTFVASLTHLLRKQKNEYLKLFNCQIKEKMCKAIFLRAIDF
jgi:hypothetical protein